MLLKLHSSTPGLQNTSLGSTEHHAVWDQIYSFDVIKDNFVQILRNGANHWVTVSTLDAKPSHINVYDSMFCSISDHTSIADQICALMHSNQPTITVHHTNVDK